MKHNWYAISSDINVHCSKAYKWWRCANCKKETEHTLKDQPRPSDEGCAATEEGSILFP